MLEFGQTIKAKREQKGLTQKQLGQLLYVSDKTVSRWENNQIYPDITMLLDISRVLEIDYQELIEGSDYIEKKKAKQEQQLRRKKKGLFYFSCLTLCLLLIFSYQFHQDERIEKTGVDYIVSKKWNEIGMTDIDDETENQSYTICLRITDYQKEQILSFLDIDHWIRVDTLPKEAKNISYQIGFYSRYNDESYKSEEYRTYQNDGIYYVVLFQDSSIIYQLPINPTQLADIFKTIPDIYYANDHSFENLTIYPIISLENIKWRSEGRVHSATNNYFGYAVVPNEDEYCFILHSSTFDIQSVDIKEDTLYITGEKRTYNQAYAIGLKINEKISISKIYINNELKYDSENHLYNLDE